MTHNSSMTAPIAIPFTKPHLNEEDRDAVMQVLRTSQITRSLRTQALEKEISSLCDVPYALAFTSGSTALWASVMALGCTEATHAYVPANTFTATGSCALAKGMQITLMDVDPKTGMILLKDLEKIQPLSPNTIASEPRQLLFPVHYGGLVLDMPSISHHISLSDLAIIEDAAQALGSHYQNGEPVGCSRYSDLTIFSLHATKNIAAGEGGIVTTRSRSLYDKLLKIRNSGLDLQQTLASSHQKNAAPPNVSLVGCNFHLTEMQAALALSQLKRIEQKKQRRQEIYNQYRDAFEKHSQNSAMLQISEKILPCIAPVAIDQSSLPISGQALESIGRKKQRIRSILTENGIGTSAHYQPLYTHSLYQEKLYQLNDPQFPDVETAIAKLFPGMQLFHQRTLSLPLFDDLSDIMVEKVITTYLEAEKKA